MDKKNCIFCDLGNELNKTLIEKFKFWDVHISLEQHTLACLIIVSKTHVEGFISIGEKEFIEFKKIIKKYENIITNLFGANWFNYLATNNKVKHLHLHMIPRYERSVHFENKIFEDKNYGDMVLQKKNSESEELLLKIKNEIKRQKTIN